MFTLSEYNVNSQRKIKSETVGSEGEDLPSVESHALVLCHQWTVARFKMEMMNVEVCSSLERDV